MVIYEIRVLQTLYRFRIFSFLDKLGTRKYTQPFRISPGKCSSTFLRPCSFASLIHCGRGEIRTHGPLARTTVFKTVALNRSATHPVRESLHKYTDNSITLVYSQIQYKNGDIISVWQVKLLFPGMLQHISM